jgi:hypothetical protein
MTFTYDDPNSSNLEAVRFRLQDTDSDRPLLTDEEIEFELEEENEDVLLATLACAEVLVARGAHKVTKKIGQMTINYSDLTAQYEKLVATIQAKIARGGAAFTMPTSGKVADAENYPKEFVPTDLASPDWEA